MLLNLIPIIIGKDDLTTKWSDSEAVLHLKTKKSSPSVFGNSLSCILKKTNQIKAPVGKC